MSGTTTRAALRYPGQPDAPNVAGDLQNLAEDTDAKLFRAFPCTDVTKPSGLVSGDRGFLIDNQTTGNLERWSGSAWVVIGGAVGGGGGSVAVEGLWYPTANQSIGNSDTVLAWADEEITSTKVTRSTSGSGHKFAFTEDGGYAIDMSIRFNSGLEGRRFVEMRNAAQSIRYAHMGVGCHDGDEISLHINRTRRFSAGQEILFIATQTGQGSLNTRYQGTSIVDGFCQVGITKISG